MNRENPPAEMHLDYLSDIGEDGAIFAIKLHGKDAFFCGDNRTYPVPEMIRLGMTNAADAAIEAGFSAWARDELYNSAADILAEENREDELVLFLKKHPPTPDNPWGATSLEKLWTTCAENSLLKGIEQLAAMAPAPAQAWRSAAMTPSCFSSLLAMADLTRNATSLASCSVAVCCEAGAVQAALKLCSLPDFDHARFADPWRAAASKRSSTTLRLLCEFGLPSNGWKRANSFDNRTPWTELATAKWIMDISLKDCSDELTLSGCQATSEDLACALKNKRFILADAIEATGASPNKACCLASLAPSKNEEPEFIPDARLTR